jgi:hypothetical protein
MCVLTCENSLPYREDICSIAGATESLEFNWVTLEMLDNTEVRAPVDLTGGQAFMKLEPFSGLEVAIIQGEILDPLLGTIKFVIPEETSLYLYGDASKSRKLTYTVVFLGNFGTPEETTNPLLRGDYLLIGS